MTSPIELIALYLLHALLFAGIVVAVICRVDAMNRKRNKLSWWAMYVAYVAFAFLALVNTLASEQLNSAYLVGLAGVVLNLWLTKKHWLGGPPPLSCKPGCAP